MCVCVCTFIIVILLTTLGGLLVSCIPIPAVVNFEPTLITTKFSSLSAIDIFIKARFKEKRRKKLYAGREVTDNCVCIEAVK